MVIVACLFFCAYFGIAVLFALRPLPFSCAPLQVVVLLLMLWMCTTVLRGHGQRLSSAWRVFILQPHLSGTWLCLLVRCCEGSVVEGCFILRSFFVFCACCSVSVLFAPRPLPFSCAPLQVVLLMLWIFTATAQSASAPSPLPPLPCSLARLTWWPRSCSRRHPQARWRSAAPSR